MSHECGIIHIFTLHVSIAARVCGTFCHLSMFAKVCKDCLCAGQHLCPCQQTCANTSIYGTQSSIKKNASRSIVNPIVSFGQYPAFYSDVFSIDCLFPNVSCSCLFSYCGCECSWTVQLFPCFSNINKKCRTNHFPCTTWLFPGKTDQTPGAWRSKYRALHESDKDLITAILVA